MIILLTNDDGIHAPGLAAMLEAVAGLGELVVVAPATQQSARSHAVTMPQPIFAEAVTLPGADRAWQVFGTPADCMKLALHEFLPALPDLVLSGINDGQNAGFSVVYSGTVSAAAEGAVFGIPSLAASLDSSQPPHWDSAIAAVRRVVPRLLTAALPSGTALNLNVPALPPAEIRGLRVTRVCRSRFVDNFIREPDTDGRVHYRMTGYLDLLDDEDDTDVSALAAGYLSLSPVHYELTAAHCLDAVAAIWPPDA